MNFCTGRELPEIKAEKKHPDKIRDNHEIIDSGEHETPTPNPFPVLLHMS